MSFYEFITCFKQLCNVRSNSLRHRTNPRMRDTNLSHSWVCSVTQAKDRSPRRMFTFFFNFAQGRDFSEPRSFLEAWKQIRKTMALDGFTFGQTVSGCFLATQLPYNAMCLVSAREEFVRDQQHLRIIISIQD